MVSVVPWLSLLLLLLILWWLYEVNKHYRKQQLAGKFVIS